MSLEQDIQNATKADQCADLLMRDLGDLKRSANPLLGDIALELMTDLSRIRRRLQNTIGSLELQYNRAADRADQVEQALREYHLALDHRQPGPIAGGSFIGRIEAILQMPWISGKEKQRREGQGNG